MWNEMHCSTFIVKNPAEKSIGANHCRCSPPKDRWTWNNRGSLPWWLSPRGGRGFGGGKKSTSGCYSGIDAFCHGRQLCLCRWCSGENDAEISMMIIVMNRGLLDPLPGEMMDAAFEPSHAKTLSSSNGKTSKSNETQVTFHTPELIMDEFHSQQSLIGCFTYCLCKQAQL